MYPVGQRERETKTMSLLWMEYETEFEHLVEKAYAREYSQKKEYFDALSRRVQKIIYRDTRYNVDYLYTAYVLKDEKVMTGYAVWLYELMAGILKELTPEQTAGYVVHHLEAIRQALPEAVSPDKQSILSQLLERGEESIRAFIHSGPRAQTAPSRYEAQINRYMDSLKRREPRASVALVREFLEQGIPLPDIYVEILSESMRRVGELWHSAQITVDAEHYCTSVTQMAMAQMYDALFAEARNQKTVLCACPGMELHEMGARMVADLFAAAGWDSIFLGAAVPVDYILESIRENRPNLLTLSVSMPQHLMDCQAVVERTRKEFPEIKIAVGGKAFACTNEIWKQWPIDLYTRDARELVARANEICK